MKKIISLILALALVLSMFALVACNKEDTGDDKGTTAGDDKGTTAPKDEGTTAPKDDATEPPAGGDDETEPPAGGDDGDEENMYPYEGDIIPPSVEVDEYGAPDADSVYLAVDPANVIHDGKGTWQNTMSTVATVAFDLNVDSSNYYDCDEKNEYVNTEEEDAVGIPGDGSFETSYVGAYYEGGVYLRQIRYYGRADQLGRMVGGQFQASEDGENWVDIGDPIEFAPIAGICDILDVPEDLRTTAYKYVRYVGPTEGYGNLAELEFWGKPVA